MTTIGRIVGCVLLLTLTLSYCCATPIVNAKDNADGRQEVKPLSSEDTKFFLGSIVENLLKPLKLLLSAQVKSIINSIIDQGGIISDKIKAKIALFVELIRPFVIKIIDRLNDIVGQGVDLKERIRMAVESIFENLGVINETNKEIIRTLVNYIRDLIFNKISLHPMLLKDGSVDFLISGIIEHLLRPLKKLLSDQLKSIINSIIDQGGQIIGGVESKIAAFVELIRPFVIRIIDRLNDIVGQGVELKERIKMAVESIFEFLDVITDANKEIVRNLIHYIVDKLLGFSAALNWTTLQVEAGRSPRLLNNIIDWLVRPIVELVQRQLNAMLLMLLDQVGHTADKLLEHVGIIAELIRPSVIKILDLTGNLHGEVDNLWNEVHGAVVRIMGNISGIANISVELATTIMKRVTDIIVEMIKETSPAVAAEQFLIIDRIIARILQPILGKINQILDQIREAVEEATEEAKQRVLRLINELSLVLKAPIVRIIGALGDLGVEIGDTVSAIRRILGLLVDSVTGIHEENKKMFKAIMELVLQSLLEMVQTTFAEKLNYSILIDIINRLLAPFIGKLNQLLDSLRAELEQSASNIAEVLNRYLEQLASLLSPLVTQIVRVMQQLGLGGRDLIENVRRTLNLIVENVAGIAEANRQLLMRLINELVSKIVDRLSR